MKKIWLLFLLPLLMLGCLSQPSEEDEREYYQEADRWIIGNNDLVKVGDYVETKGISYSFVQEHKSPVGKLYTGNGWVTGTLISENLFLTSGHIIPSNHDIIVDSGYVIFNYEDNAIPSQPYKVEAVMEERCDGLKDINYAILRLENNPGLIYGWADIRARRLLQAEALTIIQHPDSRTKEVAVDYSGSERKYEVDGSSKGSVGAGVLDYHGKLISLYSYEQIGDANGGSAIWQIYRYSNIIYNMFKRISKITVSGQTTNGTSYNYLPWPPYKEYNLKEHSWRVIENGEIGNYLSAINSKSFCKVNSTYEIKKRVLSGYTGSIPNYSFVDSVIIPGTAFGIYSEPENSSKITKTFTFYDENNNIINSLTLANTTAGFVKVPNIKGESDSYIEFYFDGVEVTAKSKTFVADNYY